MGSIGILIRHSGSWNKDNSYVQYAVEAIMIKEYATYRELVEEIAKQIGIDLSFKCVKLKYSIEGSDAPLDIHNDMGVRVYVSLKRESKNLGNYPLCVNVFNKTDQCANVEGEGSGIYAVDSFDLQAMVPADVNVFEGKNCDIISDHNHKEVMVDQVYKDKHTLKSVMAQYAIDHRFQFRTERSNAISYTLACVSEDCKWLMKASNINKSGMFRIRDFCIEHTCPLKDRVYCQRQATSNLIGDIIKPKLFNPKRKYTAKDIISDIKLDLGVDVNYMLAWRAKEKAVNSIRGAPTESYNELPGYLYVLDTTYLGSHIRMKKTRENEFLYLYVSLFAFIKGFESCRPIVVVDSSHLRGTYNGKFDLASTLDGAENILPLAYGVLDSENDASWT